MIHISTLLKQDTVLKIWQYTVLKWTVVIMFMKMAGATVWIKCIGTIPSQINQTFTFTLITVIPLQMFQLSHRHDDGNRDWFDWVSDQVLSLGSFGFLAIQRHFSVLILVFDIVRLVIADPHFLHSLGTLQSSFLFGWSRWEQRDEFGLKFILVSRNQEDWQQWSWENSAYLFRCEFGRLCRLLIFYRFPLFAHCHNWKTKGWVSFTRFLKGPDIP